MDARVGCAEWVDSSVRELSALLLLLERVMRWEAGSDKDVDDACAECSTADPLVATGGGVSGLRPAFSTASIMAASGFAGLRAFLRCFLTLFGGCDCASSVVPACRCRPKLSGGISVNCPWALRTTCVKYGASCMAAEVAPGDADCARDAAMGKSSDERLAPGDAAEYTRDVSRCTMSSACSCLLRL